MSSALFQSTPPRGGATAFLLSSPAGCEDFNPRPREGGRLFVFLHDVRCIDISIHAPARGGDLYWRSPSSIDHLFQSTPPRGGATSYRLQRRPCCRYFNPRPREGGRREMPRICMTSSTFQSTPPRGGATVFPVADTGDVLFQSTPPRGGATDKAVDIYECVLISIHAPARGGDVGL